MNPLEYYNHCLIVDRAWVDSQRGRMLADIGGCIYAIDLTVARREGGRRIDEGDLIPVGVNMPVTDLWSLDGDDIHIRYWIMLRGTWDRIANLRWPLEVSL